MAVQPVIQFNKTANTITVRATAPVVQIIERIIAQNDKPRAEIVVRRRDPRSQPGAREAVRPEPVRVRARRRLLAGGVARRATDDDGDGTGTAARRRRRPAGRRRRRGVASPPPFNLNTISRGFSTSDFYLAVPTAIVRFLESDTQTKLIAKPQLRGAEGNKLTLNLGDSDPDRPRRATRRSRPAARASTR